MKHEKWSFFYDFESKNSTTGYTSISLISNVVLTNMWYENIVQKYIFMITHNGLVLPVFELFVNIFKIFFFDSKVNSFLYAVG